MTLRVLHAFAVLGNRVAPDGKTDQFVTAAFVRFTRVAGWPFEHSAPQHDAGAGPGAKAARDTTFDTDVWASTPTESGAVVTRFNPQRLATRLALNHLRWLLRAYPEAAARTTVAPTRRADVKTALELRFCTPPPAPKLQLARHVCRVLMAVAKRFSATPPAPEAGSGVPVNARSAVTAHRRVPVAQVVGECMAALAHVAADSLVDGHRTTHLQPPGDAIGSSDAVNGADAGRVFGGVGGSRGTRGAPPLLSRPLLLARRGVLGIVARCLRSHDAVLASTAAEAAVCMLRTEAGLEAHKVCDATTQQYVHATGCLVYLARAS